MRTSLLVLALAGALVVPIGAALARSAGDAVLVTPDNFKRAETNMYFALFASRGAFGKFDHRRDLPLEGTGVRPNRDTLYSTSLFDLDAGPVTIKLPDAGKRFMSLMVINQDHLRLRPSTGPEITPTRGSRSAHAMSLLQRALSSIPPIQKTSSRRKRCRMQSRSSSPAARAARDAGLGQTSQKKVRFALLVLNTTLPDLRREVVARMRSIR